MKPKHSLAWTVVSISILMISAACAPKKNPARAAAEAARAARQRNGDLSPDELSAGGQPAQIYLYGAIADSRLQDTKVVALNSVPGVGYKGMRPDLDPEAAPKLDMNVPESQSEAINQLKSTEYVNLGCDQHIIDALVPQGSLTEKKVIPTNPIEIEANTVFVCGTNLLTGGPSVYIHAAKVVFTDSSNMLLGDRARILYIVAGQLVINGKNELNSSVPEGPVTPDSAGVISITVVGDLKVNGTFSIKAEGANYKKATHHHHDGGQETGHGGGQDGGHGHHHHHRNNGTGGSPAPGANPDAASSPSQVAAPQPASNPAPAVSPAPATASAPSTASNP